MPELPEVETVRRGLAPVMEGRTFDRVSLARPDLRFPFPPSFAQRLTGRRVMTLGRRAKYLLAHLDDGATLICHLGMSGSFRVAEPVETIVPAVLGLGGPGALSATEAVAAGAFLYPRAKAAIHDHVVFWLGDTRVIYNDPRRFGFMTIAPPCEPLEAHPYFAHLGVEPVAGAMAPDALAKRLAGKRTPLKAALLDQRVVAGLGNIYVCEALWRARLSPRRLAASVPRGDGTAGARAQRLATAIVAVIEDAIAAGGSSLRDYVAADGSLGRFQKTFAVYGRAGDPCPRLTCSGVVARLVQTGRSTFYCPVCQR